ncbi:hypothetical protein Q604_UNBC17144G0001, partial [human gut metagenome]
SFLVSKSSSHIALTTTIFSLRISVGGKLTPTSQTDMLGIGLSIDFLQMAVPPCLTAGCSTKAFLFLTVYMR